MVLDCIDSGSLHPYLLLLNMYALYMYGQPLNVKKEAGQSSRPSHAASTSHRIVSVLCGGNWIILLSVG